MNLLIYHKNDYLFHDLCDDALISINYHSMLAGLCHEAGLKYIAWRYDCSLNVISIEDTLSYDIINYVFSFDCQQYLKYYDQARKRLLQDMI